MKSSITIGNASGYWGDDPKALDRQVQNGHLDYISMDFLAEITMSIMQKQRNKNQEAGYARDFIPMLERVLEKTVEQNTCIITNAGGVNPKACAKAILDLAKQKKIALKVAIVCGDDILSNIQSLRSQGASFDNMETGCRFTQIESSLEAANIYFGAGGVVRALAEKPNIIITGRVTDTGITLAPMIHEFNWSWKNFDLLASGIVAGHIIECGAQACGGNFTDWRLVPSFDEIGYPIIEMHSDGSFNVSKHPNTGGLVSVDTIREQLVYEMGHPKIYITPDVIADFSTIQLKQIGPNKVHVSGIKGYEPTEFYKVSMAYRDGYKCTGSILVSGPDARVKSETFSNIFWNKLSDQSFLEKSTEYVGHNACHRSLSHDMDGAEIVLRLGARSIDENTLKIFSKQISPLILSGPPGVAVLGGAPKIQEVVSYWPALMPKNLVKPEVFIMSTENPKELELREIEVPVGSFKTDTNKDYTIASKASSTLHKIFSEHENANAIPLSELCLARSGDKGDTANIGVLARNPEIYEWIKEKLTPQFIKDLFQELCLGPVIRYEVPNLLALNFLLERSLGGGGTVTLRADAQGKTFAQALLRQRVYVPDQILKTIHS